MDLIEYQDKVMRTANRANPVVDPTLAAFGLVGEVGEVVDQLKKCFFHGHILNRKALIEELGDVFWYLAFAAEVGDVYLDDFKHSLTTERVDVFDTVLDLATHVGMFTAAVRRLGNYETHLSRLMYDLQRIMECYDIDLDMVTDANIAKLEKRYPEGFSQERSVNRS